MVRQALIPVLFLGLTSCLEGPVTNATSGYLNLDSLLTAQREALVDADVRLIKEVTLADSTENKTLSGDSLTLATELKIFDAIDPSKPKYTNAFRRSIGSAGQEVYTNVDDFGDFRSFSIAYQGETIKGFSGVVSEETTIYDSFKEFGLFFEQGLLSSYSVKGYQKMSFSDTVFFWVNVEVR